MDYMVPPAEMMCPVQTFQKVKSENCGYASLVGAIFNAQYSSMYSFFEEEDKYTVDFGMDSADVCQLHCYRNADCAQWYYQYEQGGDRFADDPTGMYHKCQLSAAFTSDDGSDCGSQFQDDANDDDEAANGRISAAGSKEC